MREQETLAEKNVPALAAQPAGGELQAGAQLVNRTLAEEIGVSLAPLRDQTELQFDVPGAGSKKKRK